jgi:hypothetical protein
VAPCLDISSCSSLTSSKAATSWTRLYTHCSLDRRKAAQGRERIGEPEQRKFSFRHVQMLFGNCFYEQLYDPSFSVQEGSSSARYCGHIPSTHTSSDDFYLSQFVQLLEGTSASALRFCIHSSNTGPDGGCFGSTYPLHSTGLIDIFAPVAMTRARTQHFGTSWRLICATWQWKILLSF